MADREYQIIAEHRRPAGASLLQMLLFLLLFIKRGASASRRSKYE